MNDDRHELCGRTALVTGVTRRRGIGAAIAQTLAERGARLFLTHYSLYDAKQAWGVEPDEPDAIVEQLRDAGAEVEAIEIDLGDPQAPGQLFDAATDRFGAIDVLVNNAAHSENGDLAAVTADQLDRHYRVNLRGTVLLCREFAARLPEDREGRIISITSGQGHGPMPGEIAYVATKGGIDALTLSASAELAGRRITVNAIDPGPVDTGWMPPALHRDLEARAPFGRVGVPTDVAELVAFLASPSSGWITGQVIRSRGGQ